ncbi:MAG: hypothetical protein AB7L41_15315 [Flavobacteriaceae bacterium]
MAVEAAMIKFLSGVGVLGALYMFLLQNGSDQAATVLAAAAAFYVVLAVFVLN